MSEQGKVTGEAAEKAGQVFEQVTSEDQIRNLIDDRVHITLLFQRYLDKFDTKEAKDLFVTTTKGMVKQAEEQKVIITREGEVTYQSIFEKVYQALTKHNSSVNPPSEEEEEEIKKTEANKGEVTTTTRTTGDVSPDDEEFETAKTPLADPKKYADVRMKFLKKLKTNKGQVENTKTINEIINA